MCGPSGVSNSAESWWTPAGSLALRTSAGFVGSAFPEAIFFPFRRR